MYHVNTLSKGVVNLTMPPLLLTRYGSRGSVKIRGRTPHTFCVYKQCLVPALKGLSLKYGIQRVTLLSLTLLSCLGKGLERIIARRMATLSIRESLLNPQQFGALPKRSAVDLAACVTHDVERAFAEHKVASLLTMDVSGAFNAVLRGRLILRLRQQGWHESLVRWVDAFMTERSASVRMEGVLTEPQPLLCVSRYEVEVYEDPPDQCI